MENGECFNIAGKYKLVCPLGKKICEYLVKMKMSISNKTTFKCLPYREKLECGGRDTHKKVFVAPLLFKAFK